MVATSENNGDTGKGIDANDPEQWKTVGNKLASGGDLDGAIECFSQGIIAAKKADITGTLISQLYSNRALLHLKLDKFKPAIEDAEEAVMHDPKNSKAYWRGATAAMKSELPAISFVFCQQGLQAVGDVLGLGDLLKDCKSKLIEIHTKKQALRKAEQLVREATALLSAYKGATAENRSTADATMSAKLYQEALGLDPMNGDAMVGCAELYLHGWGVAQNESRAIQCLQSALERGSVKAQIMYGQALLAGQGVVKDVPKGISLLRAAASMGDFSAQKALEQALLQQADATEDLD